MKASKNIPRALRSSTVSHIEMAVERRAPLYRTVSSGLNGAYSRKVPSTFLNALMADERKREAVEHIGASSKNPKVFNHAIRALVAAGDYRAADRVSLIKGATKSL